MLKFEIVSSRTVEGAETEKKFVAYMLQVRQDNKESTVYDPDPANVERRYTHFLDLYNGLKRDYPTLLSNLSFPRKVCKLIRLFTYTGRERLFSLFVLHEVIRILLMFYDFYFHLQIILLLQLLSI